LVFNPFLDKYVEEDEWSTEEILDFQQREMERRSSELEDIKNKRLLEKEKVNKVTKQSK